MNQADLVGLKRPTLQSSQIDFDQTWKAVSELTDEILQNPLKKPSMHVMTGYQKVYSLASGRCINIPPEAADFLEAHSPVGRAPTTSIPFAALIHKLFSDHVRAHLQSLLPSLRSLTGAALLAAYEREWQLYGFSLNTLTSVYGYVHTYWVQGPRAQDGARAVGEQLWRENVYDTVKEDLIRACLHALSQERDGVPITRGPVRAVLGSLTKLSPQAAKPLMLYQSHFEFNYLRHTEEYLLATISRAQEAARGSVRAELTAIVRVLRAEVDRVELMLHPSSVKPLMRVIATVIKDSDARRLASEIRVWVDTGCTAELEDLYWLAAHGRENSVPMLASELTAVVKSVGGTSVEAAQGPVAFVAATYKVMTEYLDVCTRRFDNAAALSEAVRSGVADFMNEPPGQQQGGTLLAPEHLAAFAHIAAKTGTSAARTELEASFPTFDGAVDAVVALLQLLDDRDVFQARYSTYLSTRVTTGAFSNDNELQLIGGIARVMAYDYSYKWRRVLSDVDRSNDDRARFAETAAGAEALARYGVDFRPLVATQGSWPIAADAANILVPASIALLCDVFEKFYKCGTEQAKKRLTWVHSHTLAVVRPLYLTKRRYELTLNIAQLALLLAFDEFPATESIIPCDVATKACIPEEMVARAVGVLVRFKLLDFVAASGPPSVETPVKLNYGMAATTLKLNLHAAREAPGSQVRGKTVVPTAASGAGMDKSIADATSRVVEDRRFALQAAIVRVAKSRRSLKYGELVADVIAVLKNCVFTPTMQAVKLNIEALIEKEYLERSADAPDQLNYVA
jgi:hypothetical protein